MASTFAFLGMLLLSMVVALLAALQLGDFFGASGEFNLVIALVAGFTVFAMAVFAATDAVAKRAGALTAAAVILAVLACAPIVLPGMVRIIAERSTNPFAVGVENTYITFELVASALLAVLVQWGLVRRRRQKLSGLEDMTHWPWITTGVAALVILNPLGLAFLQGTLAHSPTDFMWEFTATVTAMSLGALLVMAWIECYIRERILNRRVAASTPPSVSAPSDVLQEASHGRDR